jgi:hypothetical protein
MAVPSAFEAPSVLEAKLLDDLGNIANNPAVKIRVLSAIGADPTIRGTFFRWFLLEAIASAAAPITQIEIERATFTEVLNLEATTINVLLRFVECTFDQTIEMSDAAIIGFEMVGGAADIMADRLTVKG